MVGSNGETNGDGKFFERLRRRGGRCRQPTGTQISGGKGFGSPNRFRTQGLLVNSLTPLSISVPANLVRTYGLDGWCAGLTAAAVGCQRRLALVELLPEAIRQQVREGQIAAHVAMKFLVPVARVSLEDFQKLRLSARTHPISPSAPSVNP